MSMSVSTSACTAAAVSLTASSTSSSWMVIKLGGTSQSVVGYIRLATVLRENMAKHIKTLVVLSAVSGCTNLLESFVKTKDINFFQAFIQKNLTLIQKLIDQVSLTLSTDTSLTQTMTSTHQQVVLTTTLNDNGNGTGNEKQLTPDQTTLELAQVLASIPDKQLTENFQSHIVQMTDKANKYLVTSEDDEHIMNIKSEIIGFGEVFSTHILHLFYTAILPLSKRIPSTWCLAYDFIHSCGETFRLYQAIKFTADYRHFSRYLTTNSSAVYITQGFIASTSSGQRILLGRGGSDTTGAILSDMCSALEYQVWTDVESIYSADPRIVKEAVKIDEISYQHVQELSAAGAKVMHPLSIYPCMEKNIPIKIVNTFNGQNGTIITQTNNNPIGVTSQADTKMITVETPDMWNSYGYVGDIFRRFTELRVDVDIVSTSQFAISITTNEKDTLKLRELLDNLTRNNYSAKLVTGLSTVSVISPQVQRLLKSVDLESFKYRLMNISSDQMSLSFIVPSTSEKETVKLLHATFYKS